MIEKKNIELLTEDLKEYVSINMEITKLSIVEKTAVVAAGFMSSMLIGCIGLLTIIFTSICAALCLSGHSIAHYTGFALVAGFYLFLFLIVVLFRNLLFINPFRNKVIRKLLSK